MNLRARIERIESRQSQGTTEILRIDPEAWESMTPEELDAYRARVRDALGNPGAIFIVMMDEGDTNDPLAELLGKDDPALKSRRRKARISRSYGL